MNDEMTFEFSGYISGDPASFRFFYAGNDNYPVEVNGAELRSMPKDVQSDYNLESFGYAVLNAENLVLKQLEEI